jgi:hypothetical protein
MFVQTNPGSMTATRMPNCFPHYRKNGLSHPHHSKEIGFEQLPLFRGSNQRVTGVVHQGVEALGFFQDCADTGADRLIIAHVERNDLYRPGISSLPSGARDVPKT